MPRSQGCSDALAISPHAGRYPRLDGNRTVARPAPHPLCWESRESHHSPPSTPTVSLQGRPISDTPGPPAQPCGLLLRPRRSHSRAIFIKFMRVIHAVRASRRPEEMITEYQLGAGCSNKTRIPPSPAAYFGLLLFHLCPTILPDSKPLLDFRLSARNTLVKYRASLPFPRFLFPLDLSTPKDTRSVLPGHPRQKRERKKQKKQRHRERHWKGFRLTQLGFHTQRLLSSCRSTGSGGAFLPYIQPRIQ